MLTEEGCAASFGRRCCNAFHECVRHEIVPAIFADCGGPDIPVIDGRSIDRRVQRGRGHLPLSRVCSPGRSRMSGTYDLDKHYPAWTENLYFGSPLQFVPGMGGQTLDLLRHRMVVLASGSGDWEDVGESWRMAAVLGAKGVPNRVDDWGPQWPHDWHTWRAMLPKYLREGML